MKRFVQGFRAVAGSRATHFSLAFLTLGGFFGGVVFWGGFNTALDWANTEEFCITCHQMREFPYAEMQSKIHFVNRTGVRATCSDCHVPKDWTGKVVRKVQASKELWSYVAGTISTPEKFRDHRLEMAVIEWTRLKESDSGTCRNCHAKVWMDLSKQFSGAKRNHKVAIENGLTCIDCHQGIAHQLPEGFEYPTNEELIANSNAWLAEMAAKAKEGAAQ